MSDKYITQSLKVGQKVVKIQMPKENYGPNVAPECGFQTTVGHIYTIRWLGVYTFLGVGGVNVTLQAIKFEEGARCTNNGSTVNTDVPFGAYGFRPLVEETKKEEKQVAVKPPSVFQRIVDGVNAGKPIIKDKEIVE